MAAGATVMGDILLFDPDRPRQPQAVEPIDFQELRGGVYLGRTVQRVRASLDAAVKGVESIAVISPILMRDSREDVEREGTVQSVRGTADAEHEILLTHEQFPNWLIEEGLSRPQALQLAAASLITYASICNWQRSLLPRSSSQLQSHASRQSLLPKYPKLWHESAYNPNIGNIYPHVIAHRIAGRVALDATGLSDFDPVARPPFAPHAAALADPYERQDIARLISITKPLH